MPYQLVTCPETAHLEMIEYEALPIGMLIIECTRSRPAGCLGCSRTCAARFDRRGREAGELALALAADADADDTDVVDLADITDADAALPDEADDGAVTAPSPSELAL